MIYFVVSVELFSGKFKLECVESKNVYLENNYMSFFYDDQTKNKKLKKGKTIGPSFNLEKLKEEKDNEDVSENEKSQITFDGQLENLQEQENNKNNSEDKTVSPPIPFGRSSNRSVNSGEIVNIKPSPEVASPKSQRSAASDGNYINQLRFLWKC